MTDEVTAVARIAMWSGPRTISTALMRAWENRPDTVVVDEPLYGFYLARSGVPHPGREEHAVDAQRLAGGARSAPLSPAAGLLAELTAKTGTPVA